MAYAHPRPPRDSELQSGWKALHAQATAVSPVEPECLEQGTLGHFRLNLLLS